MELLFFSDMVNIHGLVVRNRLSLHLLLFFNILDFTFSLLLNPLIFDTICNSHLRKSLIAKRIFSANPCDPKVETCPLIFMMGGMGKETKYQDQRSRFTGNIFLLLKSGTFLLKFMKIQDSFAMFARM